MADRHLAEELILDLALGHVVEPERGAAVEHLLSCRTCRRQHEELAAAVEQTLAAVPRREPPPGFDGAVLEALRFARRPGERAAVRAPGIRGWTRRGVALVAAAAAAGGLAVGAGAAWWLDEGSGEDDAGVERAAGEPLRTAEGRAVGYVTRSWDGSGWMLVVNVTDGPEGARYVCRVVMADGATHDVGDWTIEADRANSWVVPQPDGEVDAVELVRPDQRVWARVELG